MSSFPKWQFDEIIHSGIDYSNADVVNDYDNQHTKFRDYEKTAARIIEAIELKLTDVILDMGCGTGGLTMHLARHCKKVYAVDISQKMVDLCDKKAKEQNLNNIDTICDGYLTYEHQGKLLDVIVSVGVLHHLPDFWKLIALKRISDILKPNGKFFLFDVVFSFQISEYQSTIDNWLQMMRNSGGEKILKESIIHIKKEFSTFDWILEKMLDIAGFKIESKTSEIPNTQAYICVKK